LVYNLLSFLIIITFTRLLLSILAQLLLLLTSKVMNKKYPSICNTFVKLSFFLFLSLFYSDTYSQNVGIGSATPTHSFHVVREMTGGNNRSLSEFQLTNNNVLIQGTFSGAYHRNDLTNTTTSTAVKVVNLS
jgi:hypothetical protein